MRKLPHVTVLALGIAGAMAFASNVQAAGFQLKENSVKSQGSSFAGTAAKTGDSSVVTNNPAVMTQFEGSTFQIDVTAIDLNYEFEGTATDAFGRPMTGSNGGNAGGVTPVPAMSYIRKLDNGVALGAMVSAPFGLKTEYDDNWVGRYFAHTSDVQIVDLALSGAIDITDRFSVGIGAIISRADVTLSRSVDFGTLLYSNPQTRPLPFALPQAADGFVEIQGDDTSLGWLVGAHFRPTDSFALGVSYRSEIDYDLVGTADWTVPGNVAAVFGASPMTAPLFQDGPGGAALTTPSVLQVGAHWQVNERFALSASWAETGWSSLREVRIEFDNPDPDAVEPFEWSDSTFVSLGAEYKLNDRWTLRGGIADDQTPTSLVHRTPRLPDDDRRWYSIGATWAVSDALDVNFAFSHLKPDDPRVDATSSGSRIVGPFDGSANLYGVSAQYRF
ncbi:outer membrane protein transport protein [Luteimonas composti]|uniref:Outer membrane protein transport protein n=1 Tax=Luteimonas composti TaxID=398257 RepID=A0ABT6MWG3_9GAMM|nr:outer membrane protein transport protein [Luteimonas composti]MDH7454556.1 outer membrane protein transport protein [Luteimonas composti]